MVTFFFGGLYGDVAYEFSIKIWKDLFVLYLLVGLLHREWESFFKKKKKKRVGERESVCKYENNITMNNHKICDE